MAGEREGKGEYCDQKYLAAVDPSPDGSLRISFRCTVRRDLYYRGSGSGYADMCDLNECPEQAGARPESLEWADKLYRESGTKTFIPLDRADKAIAERNEVIRLLYAKLSTGEDAAS